LKRLRIGVVALRSAFAVTVVVAAMTWSSTESLSQAALTSDGVQAEVDEEGAVLDEVSGPLPGQIAADEPTGVATEPADGSGDDARTATQEEPPAADGSGEDAGLEDGAAAIVDPEPDSNAADATPTPVLPASPAGGTPTPVAGPVQPTPGYTPRPQVSATPRPMSRIVQVNQTLSQYGLSLTLQRLEIGETETRVYVRAANRSVDEASCLTCGLALSQGSRELQDEFRLHPELRPLPYELAPGGSAESVVYFGRIEPTGVVRFEWDGPFVKAYRVARQAFSWTVTLS
jgi:hypothetical protein